MCLIFSTFLSETLLLSDLNETCILSTDFRKCLNTKFYKNLFTWKRVVPRRRTDMTQPIVAVRNSANAPEILSALGPKPTHIKHCLPVKFHSNLP
jgi:hypothetical protein